MTDNTNIKRGFIPGWVLIFFLIIICGFLLSFHIILSDFTIVAKKTLSFQNTFITQEQEIDILKKIYFGSIIEKNEVYKDEALAKVIDANWDVVSSKNRVDFKHHDGGDTVTILYNH